MKVLAIGNSFSQDYMTYLGNVAPGNILINTYYGGCTLEQHYNSIIGNTPLYTKEDYSLGVERIGYTANVTIKQLLLEEEYDIITIQQQSTNSGVKESFVHLNEIIDYVKRYQPKAKIYWHNTWAYGKDFVCEGYQTLYGSDQNKMYEAIQNVVKEVIVPNKKIDHIVYNGVVLEGLRKIYGEEIHRDHFHLSVLGRYSAALLFAKELFNVDITKVDYAPKEITQKQKNDVIWNILNTKLQ